MLENISCMKEEYIDLCDLCMFLNRCRRLEGRLRSIDGIRTNGHNEVFVIVVFKIVFSCRKASEADKSVFIYLLGSSCCSLNFFSSCSSFSSMVTGMSLGFLLFDSYKQCQVLFLQQGDLNSGQLLPVK